MHCSPCSSPLCTLQGVLKQPLRPLLAASALQQAEGERKKSDNEKTLENIYRLLCSCTIFTEIEYTVKCEHVTSSIYDSDIIHVG